MYLYIKLAIRKERYRQTSSIFVAKVRKSPEIAESHGVGQTRHKKVAFPRPISSLLNFFCFRTFVILHISIHFQAKIFLLMIERKKKNRSAVNKL